MIMNIQAPYTAWRPGLRRGIWVSQSGASRHGLNASDSRRLGYRVWGLGFAALTGLGSRI